MARHALLGRLAAILVVALLWSCGQVHTSPGNAAPPSRPSSTSGPNATPLPSLAPPLTASSACPVSTPGATSPASNAGEPWYTDGGGLWAWMPRSGVVNAVRNNGD